jgi:hypothetical protein
MSRFDTIVFIAGYVPPSALLRSTKSAPLNIQVLCRRIDGFLGQDYFPLVFRGSSALLRRYSRTISSTAGSEPAPAATSSSSTGVPHCHSKISCEWPSHECLR